MNKHFVFVDDSWYDRPPCDCCQGGWVESWTCTSHEELFCDYWSVQYCLCSVYELVTGVDLYENCPAEEQLEAWWKENKVEMMREYDEYVRKETSLAYLGVLEGIYK